MKTVVTITGIRPDFIRMAKIFFLLDKNFNHILIHTGQHFDSNLSGVFFTQLGIRQPDYILDTGKVASTHYEQLSYLSTAVINLFHEKNIKPDIILFLGDSNSSCCALPLKKEGYIIGHIEAGMRSGDKRMLEEINRTVCDHCSDIFFVYHDNYRKKLEIEGLRKNVNVVGNTIVEVCSDFISYTGITKEEKTNDIVLIDIHRPENFKYSDRMGSILNYIKLIKNKFHLKYIMLKFKRTFDSMTPELRKDFEDEVSVVDLMDYESYLRNVWNCKFMISDSGTAQEEPALLNTPVIVPREFTERPESMECNCSYLLSLNDESFNRSVSWLEDVFSGKKKIDPAWLGDGKTAQLIVDHLQKFLS